jgi:cob(I)alamin adenosyltransferase
MVKLTKIYTRGGDDGETSLVDGSRMPKFDRRIAAFGTVDEANASIGMVRLHTAGEAVCDGMLNRIQNDLFDLGADLATPGKVFDKSDPDEPTWVLRILQSQVDRLEGEIDLLNSELAPLNSFVLPGGTPASAYLHLARTITRRAERLTVEAAQHAPINPVAVRYLNRLSDLLFVMGRFLNDKGAKDVLWVPGANR